MKTLFLTAIVCISAATGNAQSFEGIIRYEMTAPPGNFYEKFAHSVTLKVKGKNFLAIQKNGENESKSIYLSDKDKIYHVDDTNKKYTVFLTSPDSKLTYKVTATTETKTILGHKCIKYVRKEPERTLTLWVANDLKDVDCRTLYEVHPYIPCDQINGIPLMFELAMKNNGSYTIKILEIKKEEVSSSLIQINKSYSIEEIPRPPGN